MNKIDAFTHIFPPRYWQAMLEALPDGRDMHKRVRAIPAIADLANTTPIYLIPLDDPVTEKLREQYGFLAVDLIPEGLYKDVNATVTLGIGALWVVKADLDPELVYEVTRSLERARTSAQRRSSVPRRTSACSTAGVTSGSAAPFRNGSANCWSGSLPTARGWQP